MAPPPPRPEIPSAPDPTRVFFDPYNSSSAGHQRAENKLASSASWRDSRTHKLAQQLKDVSGRGGNQHLQDLAGAGSENYDGNGRKGGDKRAGNASGPPEPGWQDIRGLICRPKQPPKIEGETQDLKRTVADKHMLATSNEADDQLDDDKASGPTCEPDGAPPNTLRSPQIFRGLTLYLNGSVAPVISDHKLKQIFAQHGGNAAIALGRRTVTHVILGNTCGGGLASGKIQKEAARVRGKGIKYVTAQWVIDSVEKGIRQPESRYVPRGIERIGGSRQPSVRGLFRPVDEARQGNDETAANVYG